MNKIAMNLMIDPLYFENMCVYGNSCMFEKQS